MYLRRSNNLLLESLEKQDEGGGTLHGPLLTVTDSDRFSKIIIGSSLHDLDYSWSRSNNFILTSVTNTSFEIGTTIVNHGDVDSIGASLMIVVWGKMPTQVGYIRIASIEKVPSISPTGSNTNNTHTENISIILNSLIYGPHATPILATSEITHLYALVYDFPLDPPDKVCTEFYMAAREGLKYFGPSTIHPCRLSRQITCTTFNPQLAFTVNGTSIMHEPNGYVEYMLQSFGTDSGASFGYISSGSVTNEVSSNIRALDLYKFIFHDDLIAMGSLSFYIGQAGYKMLHSDPNHGRMTMDGNQTDRLFIDWNDSGNDRDFGDYVMSIIHR